MLECKNSAGQGLSPPSDSLGFCLPKFWGIVGYMEPNWEKLGQRVRARRLSRGWSQATVADQGGPSDTLQTRIENGQWRPTRGVDETLSKIDHGMLWVPGSSSATLADGEPTPIEEAQQEGDSVGAAEADVSDPLAEHDAEVANALEWSTKLIEAAEALNANPTAEFNEDVESAIAAILTVSTGLISKVYARPPRDPINPGRNASTEELMRASTALRDSTLSWLKYARQGDQLMNRVLNAVHTASTREAIARGRELPAPPPVVDVLPEDAVRFLDRGLAPAPPELDDLQAAASRREKQSEREGPAQYDAGVVSSVLPGETIPLFLDPRPVPDFLRAEISPKLIRAYDAAISAVTKRTNTIQAAFDQRGPVTTGMVHSLLRAIKSFDAAARDIVAAMRNVDVLATREQIDVALELFEVGWDMSDELATYIGHLEAAAPNQQELNRLKAAQESLHALSEFHHNAHDAWVQLGWSSKPKEAGTQLEEQSDSGDGPHELSLSDKTSRRSIKHEFNSGAEAYQYAREFLIAEGEKPHLVDAALGDAGQHIADTSARGWSVRIRKIADKAATSHDGE
ncbi:Bacteriophage protein [Mycobacteroides abscessus subsp. abscessus]|nr:Bacteriophage protein [Mycobacteroides abscessus subsp. abscessus]SII32236.1 Bacteriophage protein [Mycobacteroides abscessus subsp. abscessus]SII64105.1 Bacteriophage protein [Mycobacteroides abscessus subsp. abscessus]